MGAWALCKWVPPCLMFVSWTKTSSWLNSPWRRGTSILRPRPLIVLLFLFSCPLALTRLQQSEPRPLPPARRPVVCARYRIRHKETFYNFNLIYCKFTFFVKAKFCKQILQGVWSLLIVFVTISIQNIKIDGNLCVVMTAKTSTH